MLFQPLYNSDMRQPQRTSAFGTDQPWDEAGGPSGKPTSERLRIKRLVRVVLRMRMFVPKRLTGHSILSTWIDLTEPPRANVHGRT
jgi:hypothetical protein